MDRPLVTVCFPTTGRMTYLNRALRALEAQTYAPIETLILDNASLGEAPAALRDFAERRTDTRILRVDQRVPMFDNFNRGIRAARGKYVAFFHDDDEYEPDFLVRMVALLEEHPSAVFGGGNYDVIDEEGALSRRNRLIGRTELWSGRRFIAELVGRGRSPMSTPGIVFRRDALAVQGFDPALPMNWGDFTMLMRLAEGGDVMVDAQPMYSWRVHGANASNVEFGESIPLRTEVLAAYCDEFVRRHPDEGDTAAHLRALARRTHLTGLLWGWLSSPRAEDAVRCRQLLRDSPGGRALAMLLSVLERAGLSSGRRHAMLPLLRRVAHRAIVMTRRVSAHGGATCAA